MILRGFPWFSKVFLGFPRVQHIPRQRFHLELLRGGTVLALATGLDSQQYLTKLVYCYCLDHFLQTVNQTLIFDHVIKIILSVSFHELNLFILRQDVLRLKRQPSIANGLLQPPACISPRSISVLYHVLSIYRSVCSEKIRKYIHVQIMKQELFHTFHTIKTDNHMLVFY